MLSEPNENFNSIKKAMEGIKKKQSEIKVILTETNKNLQGSNNREDGAENQISDFLTWYTNFIKLLSFDKLC